MDYKVWADFNVSETDVSILILCWYVNECIQEMVNTHKHSLGVGIHGHLLWPGVGLSVYEDASGKSAFCGI